MQTPWCFSVMGFFLVFVPIIGMHLVHKYGWEHWEPSHKNMIEDNDWENEDEQMFTYEFTKEDVFLMSHCVCETIRL